MSVTTANHRVPGALALLQQARARGDGASARRAAEALVGGYSAGLLAGALAIAIAAVIAILLIRRAYPNARATPLHRYMDEAGRIGIRGFDGRTCLNQACPASRAAASHAPGLFPVRRHFEVRFGSQAENARHQLLVAAAPASMPAIQPA